LTDSFIRAEVFRRYHTLGDPVNFVDPSGLDRYSDTVTVLTSVLDVVLTYAKVPTTPSGAVFFALSIISDKTNAIVAFTPDSNGKALVGVGLSTVSTVAAIGSSSFVGAILSGYGLGTAINNIPVYGTNQTISDWWADRIWNTFGRKASCN